MHYDNGTPIVKTLIKEKHNLLIKQSILNKTKLWNYHLQNLGKSRW